MDFADSPDEAAFRRRLRDWLSENDPGLPPSSTSDEYWEGQAGWLPWQLHSLDRARLAPTFLLDPDPSILSNESAQQLPSVQTIADEGWTSGHGLGLQLWRRGERVFAGHTGGLPGFVSILAWSPKDGSGSVILTSAGSWPALIDTGLRLAETVATELPALLRDAGYRD